MRIEEVFEQESKDHPMTMSEMVDAMIEAGFMQPSLEMRNDPFIVLRAERGLL